MGLSLCASLFVCPWACSLLCLMCVTPSRVGLGTRLSLDAVGVSSHNFPLGFGGNQPSTFWRQWLSPGFRRPSTVPELELTCRILATPGEKNWVGLAWSNYLHPQMT